MLRHALLLSCFALLLSRCAAIDRAHDESSSREADARADDGARRSVLALHADALDATVTRRLTWNADDRTWRLRIEATSALSEVLCYVHDQSVGRTRWDENRAEVILQPNDLPFLMDGTYLRVGLSTSGSDAGTYTLAVQLIAGAQVVDASLMRDGAPVGRQFALDLRAHLRAWYALHAAELTPGDRTEQEALIAVDRTLAAQIVSVEDVPFEADLSRWRVMRHPDVVSVPARAIWYGVYERDSGALLEISRVELR